MRTLLVLGLLALGAACAPQRSVTPESGPAPGRVGILVPPKGRCTGVVIGSQVRRVCLPRGKRPPPADTASGDATRVPSDSVRAALAVDR